MKSINLRNHTTVKYRREAIEKLTKTSLKHVGSYSLDESTASRRNCENMIGTAQVPLGIAGPLVLRTSNSELRTHYLPLATNEGALVASVNRGCKAIAASGGVTVAMERVGTTRGPVFRTTGLAQSLTFKQWLDDNFQSLANTAADTSSHLTLTKFGARVVGNRVYVRFYFDTQDAMGMNMVTIATEAIVQLVEKKTGTQCISVAGNFDIDKKPALLNGISGRGRRVWAEVTVPASVLRDVLKTTAQKIYDVWLAKCMLGSAVSGSLGFNAHYANVVAALFLATGQDIAHVVEGSMGITTTELVHSSGSKKDLYISVNLPSLMVGTVGGGTALATQKEALELLGVAGGDRGQNADTLAGIVAAAVLAGELSLLASLSEGGLARAHAHLARGQKIVKNQKSKM